jgi:hypothetical protein
MIQKLKSAMGRTVMLKLVSRFVLEVMPYLLSALIAAIVVPGFLISHLERSTVLAVKWVPRDEAIVADQGSVSVPLVVDGSIPIRK